MSAAAESPPTILPATVPSWVSTLVGQFGTAGILVWYLWYNVSVAGPAKDAQHEAAMAAKDRMHQQTISEMVTKFDNSLQQFRADLKEERAERREARP